MSSFVKDNKRASIVLIFDIESQTYLSIFKDCVSFNIPGGKCFNNESFEECAIRELDEETGLIVKKENLKLLLKEKCNDFEVATFTTTEYTGKLEAEDGFKVGFVPLEYLLLNGNSSWIPYHKKLLNIIKSN